MTLGRELKGLDAINSSGLWITCTSSGYEHRVLNEMNRSGL